MKFDKWTVGLAAAGVISLGSVAVAEESPITSLVSGTTFSGYVDTSGIYKPGVQSAPSRFVNTAPDTYNGVNLNVAALRIEKALDEAQWSAGYKVDLWFGPDAGALPGAFGGDNIAVKQAYVALRAPIGNGLDFKIGQVDTIIGYEVADSYANPNFSRSYGFWLEPLSHTGVIASYQVTEWLGLAGGVADSTFGDTNAKNSYFENGAGNGTLTYMGAVTLKAPESWGWLAGSSLYGGIIDNGLSTGNNLNVVNQSGANTLNYYVGVSVPTPIKEVTVGASWDYLTNAEYDGSWAQAVAGYVSWQLTEKMKVNGRVEYANSGYNAWQLGSFDGDSYIYNGNGNRLFATTATLDYSLWANVVTRLEVVWDHDLNGADSFSTDIGYDGQDEFLAATGGRNNSWLVAVNVIYKF